VRELLSLFMLCCDPFIILRHLALRVMVLMVFGLSQTPVLPVVASLAVWIDGSHKVEVSEGSEGLTLVLRHQRRLGQEANALPQGHQHGLLTRAVLTFAQGQGGTHPDHKLSFKTAKDRYDRASAIESVMGKHAPQTGAFTWLETRVDLARSGIRGCHSHRQHDVIASSGLLGLRTVVMLI
jgi:hypothetical protein